MSAKCQEKKQPQIYNTLLVALSTDLKQPRPSTLLNILDWLDTPLDLSQLEHVLDRPIAHSESPRPRVLFVDSNRKMHRAIAKALSAKVELMSVGSIDRARRALAASRFDIAVLDVALAVGSGGTLLRELRCSKGDTIPLILFSPRDAPQYGAQLRADLLKSRAPVDSLITFLKKRLEDNSTPPKDLLGQARPLSPSDGGEGAPNNVEPQPDIKGDVAESVTNHPVVSGGHLRRRKIGKIAYAALVQKQTLERGFGKSAHRFKSRHAQSSQRIR